MKHEQKSVYSINVTPFLLAPLYSMFQSRGGVTNDLATYYDPHMTVTMTVTEM